MLNSGRGGGGRQVSSYFGQLSPTTRAVCVAGRGTAWNDAGYFLF